MGHFWFTRIDLPWAFGLKGTLNPPSSFGFKSLHPWIEVGPGFRPSMSFIDSIYFSAIRWKSGTPTAFSSTNASAVARCMTVSSLTGQPGNAVWTFDKPPSSSNSRWICGPDRNSYNSFSHENILYYWVRMQASRMANHQISNVLECIMNMWQTCYNKFTSNAFTPVASGLPCMMIGIW